MDALEGCDVSGRASRRARGGGCGSAEPDVTGRRGHRQVQLELYLLPGQPGIERGACPLRDRTERDGVARAVRNPGGGAVDSFIAHEVGHGRSTPTPRAATHPTSTPGVRPRRARVGLQEVEDYGVRERRSSRRTCSPANHSSAPPASPGSGLLRGRGHGGHGDPAERLGAAEEPRPTTTLRCTSPSTCGDCQGRRPGRRPYAQSGPVAQDRAANTPVVAVPAPGGSRDGHGHQDPGQDRAGTS